ncbi:MAG: YceH family protein [Bacteroidota bacterium]|nr:YceH family protein [Bacteroidota bacterium]
MDNSKELPILNAVEQRVLGSLIEKSIATPDYYPMTLNSLTAACNQKSSRKPVVEYDEETVIQALHNLKAQSLVSTAVGGSSRVIKYKHNFTTVHPLTDGELAIMCLLLLRGSQTPGELNTNSGRLHEFSSLASVLETLEKLRTGSHPFVKETSRRPGQKETRFVHLLGEVPVETEENTTEEEQASSPKINLESRVTKLEEELAAVKDILAKITKELF